MAGKTSGTKSGKSDSAGGKKGVSASTVASGKKNDPNNFANDKARASNAGKKGGHSS